MTAARRVTWVIGLLTVVMLVAEVTAVIVAGTLSDRLYAGVAGSIGVATSALAMLVTSHQPRSVVGPLLAWMGMLAIVLAFSDTYLPMQANGQELPALPDAVAVLLNGTWIWLYVAVGLLLLTFPNGRVPGPRWGWIAWTLPAVGIAIELVMTVSPGPYDSPFAAVPHPLGDLPSGVATAAKVVLFPSIVALVVACAASLRFRYRHGDEVRRAQLKWLALGALALPATALLSWIGFLLLGTHALAEIGFAILYIAVPVATTIAILRYDLYDVDRVLSSAVTYGTVTAGVVGLFALTSFATGIVLGRQSAAAAAAVTAVATLAFAPARRRLQQAVDRRLYPMRLAAMQGVEGLRASIVIGDSDPEQLEEVLRVALHDPALRVGIAMPGGGHLDVHGERFDPGATSTPVSVRGQQVGAIASHGPAPIQLLREVADGSAMLVEMVRLRLELSAALHEVASSRSRLQSAGDEERKRLERDLHDGAQQRLVSLGMALRLAQRHLGDESVDLDGLLDEAVAQLGTAVAELREVAHGLRPSSLNDGLGPALSSLADSAALPIELEIGTTGSIPDEIATTVYYAVSETVANAVKHADASRVRLQLIRSEGELCVRIEDDGRGGASLRAGSGLAGLSDRVAAAGGSLRVTSPPSEGTAVEVVLPCAS